MFIFCVSLPTTRPLLPAFSSVHMIPGVRNARSLVPRSNFDSPILAFCPPAGGGLSTAAALCVACHRRPVVRGIEEGNAKGAGRGVRNRPRSGIGIGGETTDDARTYKYSSKCHPRDLSVRDQSHGTDLRCSRGRLTITMYASIRSTQIQPAFHSPAYINTAIP